MPRADLRAWALKGAEQRLVEIATEAARIHAEFPELRDSAAEASRAATVASKRRSLVSRKRMATAQRKRWAAVRAATRSKRR